MNHQHLIDSAVFATDFVAGVPFARRDEIEAFVKKDLLQVVDDVFNEVNAANGLAQQVFRISDLEIDLGDIPLADYRQVMPKKLREQLLRALTDVPASVHNEPAVDRPGPSDAQDDMQAQLVYFLRHGYLPWYSRVDEIDSFDSLLDQVIASSPASLIEVMLDSGQQAAMMSRLEKQFSASAVKSVRALLSAAKAGATDNAANLDDLQRQFISALLDGGTRLSTGWQQLFADHPEVLKDILQQLGQQASVRRHLAAGLSQAQFAELLRLLEPLVHGRVAAVLSDLDAIGDRGEGLDLRSRNSADSPGDRPPESFTERPRWHTRLREQVLAHLLVETGAEFDSERFIESMLRQLVDSAAALQQDARFQGISTYLRRLTGKETDAANLDEYHASEARRRADSYRRYWRLRLALTTKSTGSRSGQQGLLADLRGLTRDASWLMMRLYRELQADDQIDERLMQDVSVAVLRELVDLFLAFSGAGESVPALATPGTVASPGAGAGLAAAIRRHAEKADNQQSYYALILHRLISGELIDFNALGGTAFDDPADVVVNAGDSVSDTLSSDSAEDNALATAQVERPGAELIQRAPSALLICAELLTTASYATAISLNAQQLDRLKWQLIESYLDENGKLFNEKNFVLRFVAELMRQAKVRDEKTFRATLSRGLMQNGLPVTQALLRRLVEWLCDAGDAVAEVLPPARPAKSEPGDEAVPLETIYIANAGAVLIAPYLPRLFERLDLLEEGQFKNRDAAERAVHCIQFLVNETTSSPEFQLVLNKILCGVKPGRPIRRGIELSAAEQAQLEELLQALIQHWKALGKTSLQGLRESFLQRNGRLQLKNDAWHLSVDSGPFDMLLDQLPWSISTVKFAWMDRAIYVEWR